MSRNLTLPFFPKAPQEYDRNYTEQVVLSFSLYLEQMQNPGQGRNTRLVLTDLPLSDQGLEVGSLFQYRDASGAFVKIAVADQTNLLGLSANGDSGGVTVVIS